MHGLLSWKHIQDSLVEVIYSIILWAENGALKEVIVWFVSICYSWIDDIDHRTGARPLSYVTHDIVKSYYYSITDLHANNSV